MAPDEERVRQERTAANRNPTGSSSPASTPSPRPVAIEPPPSPPSSAIPFVLGAFGLAAFLIGFGLAFAGGNSMKEVSGLLSMVVGAVLIVGGFVVQAITRLRADLWWARHGDPH
ncbi:MAG TPA: hypothetical protein VEL75_21800 [Candidatus Methylomirabilis sp.]|nr:hypothetical protein [Candidatus Methylomirabilis sp.]